jgi:6-phosphogluconolactonase/glucosamine-6-phosphate isomerase/deaminase
MALHTRAREPIAASRFAVRAGPAPLRSSRRARNGLALCPVHWFWGDERFVPPDRPDSNYRMVFDALFSRVVVPNRNIHAIPTADLSPDEAAAYERTLKAFYGSDTIVSTQPLFDVTLLGIGEVGPTASLFPGHPALDEELGRLPSSAPTRGPHHSDLSGARQ